MTPPAGGGRSRTTDPRIEAELERVLAAGEVGIQVAAWRHGELLVDTWAGVTEPGGTQPVTDRTLFNVFSVTKTPTVTALHLQVERGLLEYDAPVVEYWPEYGAAGKERTTVRDVITHRAGLVQMPPAVTPETIGDWDRLVGELAATAPLVEPGTRNAYHSYTFGWLVGELVRRTDPRHRDFGTFLREEVFAPVGVTQFWAGLPASEEYRVGQLSYPDRPTPLPHDDPRWVAAPEAVGFTPEVYSLSAVRRACIPGTGGIADAWSVARFFGLLAGRGEINGVRLLSEDRVLSLLEDRPDHHGVDAVYGGVMLVGNGGIMTDPRGVVTKRPGERILCAVGAGSSLGWADVDSGLSFAIAHSRMVINPVMARIQGAGRVAPPFAGLADIIRTISDERG